jgi:hypothetical protein
MAQQIGLREAWLGVRSLESLGELSKKGLAKGLWHEITWKGMRVALPLLPGLFLAPVPCASLTPSGNIALPDIVLQVLILGLCIPV